MDFSFGKHKGIQGDQVKNFSSAEEIEKGKKAFQALNPYAPKDNQININGTDYFFSNIKNEGGNSIILQLYSSQDYDLDNINDEDYDNPDLILKILKYNSSKSKRRFNKEIQVLKECKAKGFQNIISIVDSGKCGVFKKYKDDFEEYLFYTMEYSDQTLKSYIENKNPTLFEKINLCISLAEGIKELFSLGYYHRDLKPSNIFIVNGTWKIGDLGLLAQRDKEFDFDNKNDFIGPKGWLSPEAMNKFLCEDRGFPISHDCHIDHQSDIFQLGRIFCYILQYNNPVGVFKQKDFFLTDTRIYQVVRTMLNYSKNRRYKKIDEVIRLLKPVQAKLFKTT